MESCLAFMSGHPLVTLCVVYMLTVTPLRIITRCLRAVKVSLRGWPPEHLDADGDWRGTP